MQEADRGVERGAFCTTTMVVDQGPSSREKWKPWYPFLAAGVAAFGEIVVMQPLDVLKTRFQLQAGYGACLCLHSSAFNRQTDRQGGREEVWCLVLFSCTACFAWGLSPPPLPPPFFLHRSSSIRIFFTWIYI